MRCLSRISLLLVISFLTPGLKYVEGGGSEKGDTAGETTSKTLIIASFPKEDVPIKKWLKENGWVEQRGNAEQFIIKSETLFMKSNDATTVIGKEFDEEIDPTEYPVIEFRVKVDEIPPGTNVTMKRREDAAFRLFVIFDKGGGWFSPPETIGYVWDSSMKVGSIGHAPRFKQVRYITIGSGTDGLGDWKTYRRNILEDYKRLFGSNEVPRIAAIALKCDSNHSEATAASAVQWIRFVPEGELGSGAIRF